MTSTPELDPLPDGVLDMLRQVSTSTIATQLYKRGFRQPQMLGVRPLSNVVDGFVAEAFTMRFIPAREDVNTLDPYRSGNTLQWDAFESVPPGHVLVVDSRGDTSAASGGDMLMTRAWKRGVAGVVTDGGLRDGHVLSQLPFPTYASRGHDHHPGGVAPRGRPAGADRLRGCRRLPRGRPRRQTATASSSFRGSWRPRSPSRRSSRSSSRRTSATKIRAGEPLAGNYPPGEEIKAEYKAVVAERADSATQS